MKESTLLTKARKRIKRAIANPDARVTRVSKTVDGYAYRAVHGSRRRKAPRTTYYFKVSKSNKLMLQK